MKLEHVLVMSRILAGILGFAYLAWRDWPLALAVLLVADFASWRNGQRPLVGPRKDHS